MERDSKFVPVELRRTSHIRDCGHYVVNLRTRAIISTIEWPRFTSLESRVCGSSGARAHTHRNRPDYGPIALRRVNKEKKKS